MLRTSLPWIAGTALLLALSAPAAEAQGRPVGRGHWGEDQAIRLLFGNFEPRGESQYWDDKLLDFTGGPEDFDDFTFGIEYLRFLGPRLGLLVSTSFYEGSARQAYLDFVDERGFDITHRTDLEITDLTFGLVYNLTRRDAVVVPYVGAGGGFYFWSLVEDGEFIDFDRQLEIFGGRFVDDGTAFGYYLQAGLEVPLGPNWSVFADGRWVRADDDLGDDFEGFGKLDLSGNRYSLGVAWSF